MKRNILSRAMGILCFALPLVFLFQTARVCAGTDFVTSGDWTYQVDDDGGITIISYQGKKEEIVLDQIDGYDVVAIGENAFKGNHILQKILLPDTLRYIGDGAFYQCNELVEFTVPEGVTEIGSGILYNCVSLKKLDVRCKVQDLKNICISSGSLEKVTLSEGIKVLPEFSGCYSLKEINIPDSVERIASGTFFGCAMESIFIPSGVNVIEEGSFAACTQLEEIQVAKDNVHFYVKNGFLFNDEHVLLAASVQTEELVEVPVGCTKIGSDVFCRHTKMTGIVIPDTVTGIGTSAFAECSSLDSIQVGGQIEQIGSSAFWDTAYIQNPVNWEDGVCYLGPYAIETREDRGTFQVREGCTLLADCLFFHVSDSETALEYVALPDSLEYIGEKTFWLCSSLKRVSMGKNIKSIGKEAFFNAYSLESICLRGHEIRIGEEAFGWCSGLKNIMIEADKLSLSEGSFRYCTSVQNLVLPELNVSLYSLFYRNGHDGMKVALTDTTAAEWNEHGAEYFADAEKIKLYLSVEESEILPDSVSGKKYTVSYRNQWHFGCFLLENNMTGLFLVEDGGELPVPLTDNAYYFYLPEGPVFCNIKWDINADGIPDEIPATLSENLWAEAVYSILEETHSWEIQDILQTISCTQDEEITYHCAVCDSVKTIVTPAFGHYFSREWTEDVAATCTSSGIKSHACTREGCTERTSITLTLPLGHQWNLGELTLEPGVDTEGEKTYTCERCGETKTEKVAPLGTQPLATPTGEVTLAPVTEPTDSKPTETPDVDSPTQRPTVTETPLNLPTETPSVTPSGTPSGYSENKSLQEQSRDSLLETEKPVETEKPQPIKKFRITANYTKITLKWSAGRDVYQYWIYRSNSRKSGFKLLKKLSGSRTSYQDIHAVSGKKYYYQIKIIQKIQGKTTINGKSTIQSKTLKALTRPVVRLRRRRAGTIQYLDIYLKKFQGKKIEIYYRKGNGKYRKLKLSSRDIVKQQRRFRIRYLSSGDIIYLKLRTYDTRKGKRVYLV